MLTISVTHFTEQLVKNYIGLLSPGKLLITFTMKISHFKVIVHFFMITEWNKTFHNIKCEAAMVETKTLDIKMQKTVQMTTT